MGISKIINKGHSKSNTTRVDVVFVTSPFSDAQYEASVQTDYQYRKTTEYITGIGEATCGLQLQLECYKSFFKKHNFWQKLTRIPSISISIDLFA